MRGRSARVRRRPRRRASSTLILSWGFIKAEIVSYDDLVQYGSVAEARAHGRVRMEGKDYVMSDGDVVEFRFNV